ncbi:unnamed protein product [Pleuronectes platessa]|uniref:Uncharacterized protein n=1 Tax=Pleuronectes platessa TaxID=8262 RepID=A0A9N7UUG0_PLEPL|nr:unnamed protein product [Pleuronectes platessa]
MAALLHSKKPRPLRGVPPQEASPRPGPPGTPRLDSVLRRMEGKQPVAAVTWRVRPGHALIGKSCHMRIQDPSCASSFWSTRCVTDTSERTICLLAPRYDALTWKSMTSLT